MGSFLFHVFFGRMTCFQDGHNFILFFIFSICNHDLRSDIIYHYISLFDWSRRIQILSTILFYSIELEGFWHFLYWSHILLCKPYCFVFVFFFINGKCVYDEYYIYHLKVILFCISSLILEITTYIRSKDILNFVISLEVLELFKNWLIWYKILHCYGYFYQSSFRVKYYLMNYNICINVETC